MNFGIDFLGGARYAKTVLQEHPRSYGFGIFADVDGFGKAYDLIDKVAALGVPFIRVQAIWKDDHNFGASELKTLENRCKLLLPIIKKHPSVKWYVSPCCEHNLDQRKFQLFADVVAKYLGGLVSIVNSPNFKKGFVSKDYLNEYHHEEKPRSGGRFAFSFDGANCVDNDVTKYKANYKDAEYFFWWNSQCNGRRNLEDKTPRKDRKYWPTDKQIDSWIWLAKDKGNPKLPAKWLLKSHSDQHTVPPSGKDQKPVWIIPVKARAVVVKASNGQVIDEARYFGTFQGGGFRYYHQSWGYELAQKAIRIQGHPVCDVFVNNKKIGSINLAFREGNYR
jgi:hypothetical protein